MFFTRASLNGKICQKNCQVFSSKLGFLCRNSAVGSDATGGLSLNHKNSKKILSTHIVIKLIKSTHFCMVREVYWKITSQTLSIMEQFI